MTFTAATHTVQTTDRRARVGDDGLTGSERLALAERYSRTHELTNADRQAFADFLKRKRAA